MSKFSEVGIAEDARLAVRACLDGRVADARAEVGRLLGNDPGDGGDPSARLWARAVLVELDRYQPQMYATDLEALRADLRFATATDEFSVEREADLADKLARAGFVAASVVVYEDLLGPQPGSRRVPPSDLNRSKARLADCLRRMGRGQEASAILADLPRPTFAGQGRVVAGVLALVAAALSLCGLFLPWVDEPPGCIPLGQSGIDDLRGDIMLLVGACILIVVAVRILASGDGRLGIVSFAGFVLIVLGSYLRLSAEAVCLGSSAGPSLWLVLAGSAIYVTALITSQVTARSAKRRLETNTRSRDASSSG